MHRIRRSSVYTNLDRAWSELVLGLLVGLVVSLAPEVLELKMEVEEEERREMNDQMHCEQPVPQEMD